MSIRRSKKGSLRWVLPQYNPKLSCIVQDEVIIRLGSKRRVEEPVFRLNSVLLKFPEANLILDGHGEQGYLGRLLLSMGYETHGLRSYLSPHLRVCVGSQVADYLGGMKRRLAVWKKVPTCSADIPLSNAFLTLSRVMDPTTRFGNRYLSVMNRFNTAVWSGLSMGHISRE